MSSSQTLFDILSAPLSKLAVPARFQAAALPPGELSNGLTLSVEVDPRRGLSAMYTVTQLFNQRVLECASLYLGIVETVKLTRHIFFILAPTIVVSTQLPNPPLTSLPDEASEIDVPPQTLRKSFLDCEYPIEATVSAVKQGVLGAAQAILHTVFRDQFLKKENPSRESIYPYRQPQDGNTEGTVRAAKAGTSVAVPPISSGSSQTSNPADYLETLSDFQWAIHRSSFIQDARNSVGMLSWSPARIPDPNVYEEADFLPGATKRTVECRVLFFTFGAWYVLIL